MPEWMNDNDNDNPLDSSPFEPDPPFSSSSSKRQSNETTEQSKVQTLPIADDTASNTSTANVVSYLSQSFFMFHIKVFR